MTGTHAPKTSVQPTNKGLLTVSGLLLTMCCVTMGAHGDGLDDCVKHEMQAHGIPAVSLAIIQDRHLLWVRAYGTTAAGEGTAITSETLFQAASISKVPTAACALMLVQKGVLTLDDNVNNWLKDWKVPENEFTRNEKVTVRRILSHTAGFSVHGFIGYGRGQTIPQLTDILNGAGVANNAPIRVESIPGSQWKYSGGGYTVLQKVMIDVTGQPFPALMREMILDPLKMEHSTFEQPLPAAMQTSAACGQLPGGEKLPGQWHTFPEMAAAGLWTTPSDLARLFIAIQEALGGRTDGVISPAVAQWMATPVRNADGLGLLLSGTANEFFGHDGRNAGFDSLVRCSATDGVAIMMNANDNSGALDRICNAAWTAARLKPAAPRPNTTLDPTVDPKTYPDYVGRYDYGRSINEITAENGHLYTQLTGQQRFELFPSGHDAFFLKVVEAGLIFQRDANGKVTGLMHIQNGKAFSVPKLPAATSP